MYYEKEERTEQALTGNAFIDAYNLGYEAGRISRNDDVRSESDRAYRNYSSYSAEKDRADQLEERVAELEAKVSKLRKKLKERRNA